MALQNVRWGGMDWTDVAQGRDKWGAFMKAVMNFKVP
jgi:hypothetical protein